MHSFGPTQLRSAECYRQKAERIRLLANASSSDEVREALRHIAESYETVAAIIDMRPIPTNEKAERQYAAEHAGSKH